MIMEPNKSQDLQLASWRPRRADSVVPIWDWSSNLKAEASRPKKVWVFSSIMNPGKELMSQLTDSQAGEVPSYSGKGQPFHSIQAFSWFFRNNLHWEGQYTFLSLQIQMLIASIITITDTPRIMFDQTSGYLLTQSSWHAKLAIVLGNEDNNNSSHGHCTMQPARHFYLFKITFYHQNHALRDFPGSPVVNT